MIRALPAHRLLPIAVLGVALLLAGCTPARSPARTPGATAGPGASAGPTLAPGATLGPGVTLPPGTTASPPAPSGAMSMVRVYFVMGSFTDDSGLVPVAREIPVEAGGAAEWNAIAALLVGPNEAELGATPAMYTLMPEGTRLNDVRVEDGIATIDLSGEFESGGGSASAKGRLAQVVYTLTQFSHITGVRFEVDGTPVTTFSDAGLDLSAPVDRKTYTDQLPAIFIDQPAWGGTIDNPAHLEGLANVFEATFRFRLLDAAGRTLAESPLKATCGTGCWGDWSADLPYSVAAAGAGTLQVWEPSAVDGSPTNLTVYPVNLTP